MKKASKDGPDPIDRHVGTRVKTRRVGLRMSQTSLGREIGVTFQQIQKYENGGNRIGASNLAKIARALAVGVGYFYEGLDMDPSHQRGLSDPAAEYGSDPMTSREAIELVHNFFRIRDAQVRKRVFQFVRALAGNIEGADATVDGATPLL
jgi:transcriptional regulator with XRE-family HTH domain